MAVRTLTSLAQIEAPHWDALLPSNQPFLRHGFLNAFERSASVGVECGWQPAHRLAIDGQGKVTAALPAYIKQHSYGEYVFDHGWAEACQRAGIAYYPKLLVAVPFSPVAGARLLGPAAACEELLLDLEEGQDAQSMSGVHVNFTSAACNELLAARLGWLQRLGCQFHWQHRGYRDFQDFLETLTSRKRKQVRKERAAVLEQGVECVWHSGTELDQAQWDFIYHCYAATYQVRGRPPYLTREFFSELAQSMAHNIRVLMAYRQGRAVAMALYLDDGERLYGRYWGCVEEVNCLHFEACIYQGIEHAIARNIGCFDAGAQGEHKLIRGFEPTLTHSWHYLRHQGLREAVEAFLQQERSGVLAYLDASRKLLPYRHS